MATIIKSKFLCRALGALVLTAALALHSGCLAVIVVRTAEDKKIEIRVSSVSAAQTNVQIRVGVFGDEALSQRILEKIRINL